MYSHRNLITLCLQRQGVVAKDWSPLRAPVTPTSPRPLPVAPLDPTCPPLLLCLPCLVPGEPQDHPVST